jgi:putative membrane protein
MLQEMQIEHLISAIALLILTATYSLAWRRLRSRRPKLATGGRLSLFLSGMILLGLAFVWPVSIWAESLLAGRAVQKVLLCMLAPPLLWLGLPFHVIAWGLPVRWRKRVRLGPILRRVTHPLAAWLLFISAFLLWHDPTYVNWAAHQRMVQTTTAWLLLGAALLFWWHVVNTGPRLHPRLPGWIMAVYLLAVEIPNMAAGITIAFTVQPIYPAYAELQQTLTGAPFTYASDQMIGGAIIWVFGSIVYISAIIGVLYQLFRREGSTAPQPPMDWDNAKKVIAPGLEHRLHNGPPKTPWRNYPRRS